MKLENKNINEAQNPQRDIYQELRVVGLTHDQCSDVMDLIDTLPIHIKEGVNNTKVSVSNGLITVEPNHVELIEEILIKELTDVFQGSSQQPLEYPLYISEIKQNNVIGSENLNPYIIPNTSNYTKQQMRECWDASSAHTIGSHIDFKQSHPDFNEFIEGLSK